MTDVLTCMDCGHERYVNKKNTEYGIRYSYVKRIGRIYRARSRY
jgi:hypothetical protein